MGLMIHAPKIKEVTVSRDGVDVLLIVNGQRVAELPWDAAIMVGGAIITQGRRIEEQLKANEIAFDQALLTRKGIPLGLTSNPRILEEARKETAWNALLRRYIPQNRSIDSKEAVGTPTLIKHDPEGV